VIEDLDHVVKRNRRPWQRVLKLQDLGPDGQIDPVYLRCKWCKEEFEFPVQRSKHEPLCYAKLHNKELKERSEKL